jgi:mono/diheme cytochrome c family protein
MTRITAISLACLGAAALAIPALAIAADEPAKLTDEQVKKGRQLFADNSCGACHTLADGGGGGGIGPSLDNNTHITLDLAVDRIANGAGPMPAFQGTIPDEDIPLLARYVLQVKK